MLDVRCPGPDYSPLENRYKGKVYRSETMEKFVWKTTLAYDGSDFRGWQIQPGEPTIQGLLSDAIAAVTGERVLPQGAGRTDAGVHALGQVASFSIEAPIPPENLQRALNRVLPASVRILTAEHAPPGFHARHSTVGKIYRYRVFSGATCSPFLARYVTQARWLLDLDAMQEAAQIVLGKHDFTSFAAYDPDRAIRVVGSSGRASSGSNVRRIESSHWSREVAGSAGWQGSGGSATVGSGIDENDSFFTYVVRGDGFLHHMVRNLVGTFFEVGRGRLKPSDVRRILAERNRALAGPTAPASGLCLMQVLYGEPEL